MTFFRTIDQSLVLRQGYKEILVFFDMSGWFHDSDCSSANNFKGNSMKLKRVAQGITLEIETE